MGCKITVCGERQARRTPCKNVIGVCVIWLEESSLIRDRSLGIKEKGNEPEDKELNMIEVGRMSVREQGQKSLV